MIGSILGLLRPSSGAPVTVAEIGGVLVGRRAGRGRHEHCTRQGRGWRGRGANRGRRAPTRRRRRTGRAGRNSGRHGCRCRLLRWGGAEHVLHVIVVIIIIRVVRDCELARRPTSRSSRPAPATSAGSSSSSAHSRFGGAIRHFDVSRRHHVVLIRGRLLVQRVLRRALAGAPDPGDLEREAQERSVVRGGGGENRRTTRGRKRERDGRKGGTRRGE